jgi:hypothetical protein
MLGRHVDIDADPEDAVASMSLRARPLSAISWVSHTAYSSAVRLGLVAARHEARSSSPA